MPDYLIMVSIIGGAMGLFGVVLKLWEDRDERRRQSRERRLPFTKE